MLTSYLLVNLAMLIGAFSPMQAIEPVPRCPLELARYVLRDYPGITAGFQVRPTDRSVDLLFFIHSTDKNTTHWFLAYSGNGQGISTHLASIGVVAGSSLKPPNAGADRRELDDLDYLAADKTYRFMQSYAAYRSAEAPEHIFIPELQHALWYQAEPREGVPVAFFDLQSCANPRERN
ncbi:MAG TPA: hypothetical protein VGG10_09850 [Rhizomicrobium sp.]|jgi:hypothetical protein